MAVNANDLSYEFYAPKRKIITAHEEIGGLNTCLLQITSI